MSELTIPAVEQQCNGLQHCTMTVGMASMGDVDPCPGTFKYAHASYRCIQPNPGIFVLHNNII